MFLLSNWVPSSRDWEAWLPLNQSVKEFARWWTQQDNVLKGGTFVQAGSHYDPVHGCIHDRVGSLPRPALSVGGVVWGTLSEHINVLEMRAVLLALQSLWEILHSKVVCVATDNSTVAVYLERQGVPGLTPCVHSLFAFFFLVRKCI